MIKIYRIQKNKKYLKSFFVSKEKTIIRIKFCRNKNKAIIFLNGNLALQIAKLVNGKVEEQWTNNNKSFMTSY